MWYTWSSTGLPSQMYFSYSSAHVLLSQLPPISFPSSEQLLDSFCFKAWPIFPYSFTPRYHRAFQKSHLEAERSFSFLWIWWLLQYVLDCYGRITPTSVCLFCMEESQKHFCVQRNRDRTGENLQCSRNSGTGGLGHCSSLLHCGLMSL